MQRLQGCAVLGFLLLAQCGGSGAPGAVTLRVRLLSAESATAGDPVRIEVAVVNAAGVPNAAFRGMVTLFSSDAQAVLPDLAAFTAADAGVREIEVELRTAGEQVVGAREASADDATVTVAVDGAPVAAFLVEINGPQQGAKGRMLEGTATITAVDAFGNVDATFNAARDPVALRVEPETIGLDGLPSGAGNVLAAPDDFVDGVADIAGRVRLVGESDRTRLEAASSTGASGMSAEFDLAMHGPSLAPFARYADVNRNLEIDAGDTVALEFDEDIAFDAAGAADFVLGNGDSLGANASVAAGPEANELTITLGAGATFALDGTARITPRADGPIVSVETSEAADSTTPATMTPVPVRGPQVVALAGPRGVAVADFDGDGRLDVAVAHTGRTTVLINDGTGGFEEPAAVEHNAAGRVAAGDIDGDGDIDLVSMDSGGADILTNDGTGVFEETGSVRPPSIILSFSATDVALGDLDADGDLDLVISHTGELQPVFLNDGTGRFTHWSTFGPGTTADASFGLLFQWFTERISLVDFDGDGALDIVAARKSQFVANEVWKNNGAGGFTRILRFGRFSDTAALATGDLDGDGDPDIVLGEQNTPFGGQTRHALRVYRNDGTETPPSLLDTLDTRGIVDDIALADVDGDGALDIVSTRGIWLNRGGRFEFVTAFEPLPGGSGAVATGDFDADGALDTVLATASTPEDGPVTAVHFGSARR